MEVQLQQFVSKVETIADVRNSDPRNPVAIDMDIPGLSMRFRIVGSIAEPTYQAYPINLIWVVLDPDNLYYRRVLQLKSKDPNDPAVEDRVTDATFLGTWIEVLTYDNLFLYPQYYATGTGGGEQGPPGPPGYNLRGNYDPLAVYDTWDAVYHAGSSYYATADGVSGVTPVVPSQSWSYVALKGDTPVVDYTRIVNEVVDIMTPTLAALEIRDLPATVISGRTASFTVWARYNTHVLMNEPQDREFDVTSRCTFTVTPTNAGTVPTPGSFAADASLDDRVEATITAHYTDYAGAQQTATATITVVVPLARFGVGPRVTDTSLYDQAFLENVTNTEAPRGGLTFRFDINQTANEFGWFAHPKAWGTARFESMLAPGFYGGWDGARNAVMDPTMWGPIEVEATFDGVTEPWLLYRTDNHSLGQSPWSVTPQP